MSDETRLPTHTEVVIVGGGVAGCSVAYHLSRLGACDVALLERGVLTCGTTWHAAGLVMQLRQSHSLTELARYNVELYAGLEAETGYATGFKQNGTLGVARTAQRMVETRRLAAVAKSFGIEAHLISAAEAHDLYAALDRARVRGAIYIPGDGQTNPVDTTMALAAGARQRGVRVHEQIEVLGLAPAKSGGYRVRTHAGDIECETLVLCAGLWTRSLARQLQVNVPLYPCEHMYVVTEALDLARPDLPVLRDTDGYVYLKEDAGRLLVGSFEPQGKPLAEDRLPADSRFVELPEDWDHFELPFTHAMEMVPALEHVGIARFMNGPESFTPDLLFALGEVPARPRCFVAAGFNSEGVEFSPGAGRALAQWIVEGAPKADLSDVDIARFHSFQSNRAYLRERAGESVGLHYKMHWPHKEREAARPVRKSPLYDRLAAMNACFGEGAGWERALWFAPPRTAPVNEYSYERPNWFEPVAEEHRAAREGVVVLDMSSFGKHLVHGRDACRALQQLCTADVDVAPGKLVYTHMLNGAGGIEADVTVNRLDDERFLLVSSATTHARDKAWIERHLAPRDLVSLTDVSSCYAVLSVQGPRSRALLQGLTGADLSNRAFPFATSREIDFGPARVIANRLTFVGELGWELFVPADLAAAVFDLLTEAGARFGLRQAGYFALEGLRAERGYCEYGLELTPAHTPLEAGLGFVVKLSKPHGFVGRGAIEAVRAESPRKRLVRFRLAEPDPQLYRDEPIWLNASVVGHLTSGAFGYTLGRSVGMGYVCHSDPITEQLVQRASFEIEIAGERHAADASLRSFYDPDGERVKM